MAVPGHIAAAARATELPGALVTDFSAAAIGPGIEKRISRGLHLLVGGYIDRLIGSSIAVRAIATVAAKAGGIGLSGINCVVPKVVMVGTEGIRGALALTAIEADIGIGLSEDKENVVNARGPTVGLLSMGYLSLDIGVQQGTICIGPGIGPASGIARARRDCSSRVFVLSVVFVEAGASDILKIALNQAMVGGRDIVCGLPENSIRISRASLDQAPAIV